MRKMLKGKIHQACVTGANIEYEGSITIDRELMEAADILPYEKVHVLDVTNGARLETYAMEGKTGEICINGAAARQVSKGDKVIILAYALVSEEEARNWEPRKVFAGEQNEIISIKLKNTTNSKNSINPMNSMNSINPKNSMNSIKEGKWPLLSNK